MRPSLRLPRQPLLGADVTYVTHWECVRNGTQWPWNAVAMERSGHGISTPTTNGYGSRMGEGHAPTAIHASSYLRYP